MSWVKAWAINFCLILVLFTIGAYLAHQDTVRRNDRRAAFAHADLRVCEEINSIKAALRAKENENYQHRFRDLKILKVPITAKVLQIIQVQHDRQLDRLRAADCQHLPSQ